MIAEFDGVKALLESVPLLAGKVVDTAVANDGTAVRGNYLVLFGPALDELNDDRDSTVPQPDSDAIYEFALRAVGTMPGTVREICSAVLSLVGSRPEASGRRCDPITVSFETVKADNAVSPPLYFSDMWVHLTSRRG